MAASGQNPTPRPAPVCLLPPGPVIGPREHSAGCLASENRPTPQEVNSAGRLFVDAARRAQVTQPCRSGCRLFFEETRHLPLVGRPGSMSESPGLDGVALRPLGGARSLCLGDPYAQHHLGRQGKGIFTKRRRLPL